MRVLAGVGAVVALILVIVIPKRLAPRHLFDDHATRLGVENEIRRTIIQMLGGSFVLASVFFTYQTVRISQESLTLTERGQITERFTRAVDQIGSGKLDVAVGGLYALGQLARESRTEHAPIVDILSAYIHEHAGRDPNKSCRKISVPEMDDSAARADVQAAITVLGQRNLSFETSATMIDLKQVDLTSGNFSNGTYEHVVFSGSCLSGANFQGATLEGTTFGAVRLTASTGALGYIPTELVSANFQDAHAPNADFSGTSLENVNMRGATLTGANFNSATLGVEPRASGAGTLVFFSDLSGADLRNATFEAASLFGINLRGANLENAEVSEHQLEQADTDDTTIFP